MATGGILNHSTFLPCKLLLYGPVGTGRRTLITRLLDGRCLSDWKVEDKNLVNISGENALAMGPIPLCGTTVQLICLRNPKIEQHLDAGAVVILYDVTDEQSLKYAHRFILEIQHSAPSMPVLLVGNKLDLQSDTTLTMAAVQAQFSPQWSNVHRHFQLSAMHGHGMTGFVAAAIAIPFLKAQHTKLSHRSMDWNVVAEQAMLWAFDHSMDSLVSYLKSAGMRLSATVIQLHAAAVEKHLHRVKPWRAINVAATQCGKPCRRIWKSLLTPKKPEENEDEMSDEEKEIMMAMMNGTILVHEHKSPATDGDPWQAIDVDSDGEDVRGGNPDMGCCVQWSRMMLETFVSSWLTQSCTALGSEVITHLSLSHNCLTFIPLEVYRLPSLVCLIASNNYLTEIPDGAQWARLSKLQFLDLSCNRIVHTVDNGAGLMRSAAPTQRREAFMASSISPSSGPRLKPGDLTQSLAPGAVSPMLVYDDPRYSLAPLLWFMDLSRNKIRQLPAWILRLPSLSCLDLSYNRLQDLPSSLTALTSLQELRVTDVASIPQHIISSGSASLLGHLGLTHNQVMSPSSPTSSASSSSSSAEERRLQLVVFGPEGSGKSTLVHNLTGKKFEETDSSAQYLTYQRWLLNSPDRLRFFKPGVQVDLWDFSGKELVRPLHSSLGSRYALHLVVCSMVDVRQSCQSMARYLVQLQTLHSGALLVIVVFTHYDQCGPNKAVREAHKRQCQQWLARIQDEDIPCMDGILWPSTCRPRILGGVFVSTPKGTGLGELQSMIYSTALELTSPQPTSGPGHRIALPKHCIATEKAITAWRSSAEGYSAPMLVCATDLWQKLHKKEMLKLALNEFINALTLLGTLGLCTFFPPTANSSHTTGVLVLDQHKMCNMLADVLRLTDKISRAADDPSGIFTQADLAMILTGYFTKEDDVDDRLPWQYLSVIESVNICTPLSNGTIFTPSGLAVRFADVSAPLVWSERSVARLFCVPCLSPIFWSLLLQQLACKLEYVGFLYATLPDKELAELLSGMHRKAIFWRTGCLLRSEGYQALVRATPQRVHSPLSSPKPSRGSVDDNSEPALNYIDVLVEASENFVSVKLLQVITQAIVDTIKLCSRNVALVETKGVLECLLICPACRGSTPLQHSLLGDVYARSMYHFTLPFCIMALDAQMEDNKRRRLSSSAKSNDIQGKLGCAKNRVLVPLKMLIPDVLCEDLREILTPTNPLAGAVGSSAAQAGRVFASLPRIVNGKIVASDQTMSSKVFTRRFPVMPSSMAVDYLLQPYNELRWRTETLLLVEREGLCPRPGSLVGHPPILRLPAPFKCSLAGQIERTGRGFKRQHAHSIGHQLVSGLQYLVGKGVVHCSLTVDSIHIHDGRTLKICLSDSGLRQLQSNDDVQEMFIQLGVVLYEVVSGERLLCGILNTKQLVRAFRSKRLRPSLDELMLDIFPLPKEEDEVSDRQGLQPHHQPRMRSDTTSSIVTPTGRRCNSDGTHRRRRQERDHNNVQRWRSNSDVTRVTQVDIDRLLSSCSKLCMQSVMEKCWSLANRQQICADDEFDHLRRMLALCCAATQWSPACLDHHITAAAHYSSKKTLVWATGVPRIQLGRLDLVNGVSQPQPISFIPDTMPHLRRRHVAVRSEERVTSIAIAETAQQIWVGVERNTSGAVYVFSCVTQEIIDSIDFEEDCDSAVLTVLAVPHPRQAAENKALNTLQQQQQ
eukprot:scpid7149/ scgid1972/ 